MTMWSIQVGNTPSGVYDPHESLPYPYHVNEQGRVDRQDFWQGDPLTVIGFQRDADVHHVDLTWAQAQESPEKVPGMFVVTNNAKGRFSVHTYPITRIVKIEDGAAPQGWDLHEEE